MRAERIGAATRGGSTADVRLARALAADARAAGIAASVGEHRSHPWASATFVGARHRLAILAPSEPSPAAWIAALPEAALSARGHLVADLAVATVADDGTTVTAQVEVLTIEDA